MSSSRARWHWRRRVNRAGPVDVKTHAKIFRKTWVTYKNVIKKKEQRGLGDF